MVLYVYILKTFSTCPGPEDTHRLHGSCPSSPGASLHPAHCPGPHFSLAQGYQSLSSQRRCVSASLQPRHWFCLLDGPWIYIIALSLALTLISDWVSRMDSGPGAPLNVSRLSMDPVTSPWLCQLYSGPVELWPIIGSTPCTGVTLGSPCFWISPVLAAP